MASPATLRRVWFDRGANALACIADDDISRERLRDRYACPLCLGLFPPSALNDGLISLEHIPSRKLGGKAGVLTCRRCNNHAGTHLESSMERERAQTDFLVGTDTREIKCTVVKEDVRLRGRVRRANGDGTIVMAGVEKANPPGTSERSQAVMDRWVDEGGDGRRFHLEFDEPFSWRAVRIGWLRTAYLAAFAWFGYSYILKPPLDVVRAQLEDPKADLMPLPVAVQSARVTPRVFIVKEPDAMRALVVSAGRYTVYLPSSVPQRGFFDTIADRVQDHVTDGKIEVRGQTLPWPTHPSFVLDG